MPSRRPNQQPVPVVGVTPAARPQVGIQSVRPASGPGRTFDDFAPLSRAAANEASRQGAKARKDAETAGIAQAEKDFEAKVKPNGERESDEEVMIRLGKKLNRLIDQEGGDVTQYAHYHRQASKLFADRAGSVLHAKMEQEGKDLLESMIDPEDGLEVVKEEDAARLYLEKVAEIDEELRGKVGGSLLEAGGSSRYFTHQQGVKTVKLEKFLESWRKVRDVEVQGIAKEQAQGAWEQGGIQLLNETLDETYTGIGGGRIEREGKESEAVVFLLTGLASRVHTDQTTGLTHTSPEAALEAMDIMQGKNGLKINGRYIKEGDTTWVKLDQLRIRYENELAERPALERRAQTKYFERNGIELTNILFQSRKELGRGPEVSWDSIRDDALGKINNHEYFKDNESARNRAIEGLDEQIIRLRNNQVNATEQDNAETELAVETEYQDILDDLVYTDLSDEETEVKLSRLSQLGGTTGIGSKLSSAIRESYIEFDPSKAADNPFGKVRELQAVRELRGKVDQSGGRLSSTETRVGKLAEERMNVHLKAFIAAEAENWDPEESPARVEAKFDQLEQVYDDIEADARAQISATTAEMDEQLRNLVPEFTLTDEMAAGISDAKFGEYQRSLDGNRQALEIRQERANAEHIARADQLLTVTLDQGDAALGELPQAASLFKLYRGFEHGQDALFTDTMKQRARKFIQEYSGSYQPFDGSQGTMTQYEVQRKSDIDAALSEWLLGEGPNVHEGVAAQLAGKEKAGESGKHLKAVADALDNYDKGTQAFVDAYVPVASGLTDVDPVVKSFTNVMETHRYFGKVPVTAEAAFMFALSDAARFGDDVPGAALWLVNPTDALNRGVEVQNLPDGIEVGKLFLGTIGSGRRGDRYSPNWTAQAYRSVEWALETMEANGRTTVAELIDELEGTAGQKAIEDALVIFQRESNLGSTRVDVKDKITAGTMYDWSEPETQRTSAQRLKDIKRVWFKQHPRGTKDRHDEQGNADTNELETLFDHLKIDLNNDIEIDKFFDTQKKAIELFPRSHNTVRPRSR